MLCGGTYSVSLVSFNVYHLATLFEKKYRFYAFTKMFLIIKTLKVENKPFNIDRDHDQRKILF